MMSGGYEKKDVNIKSTLIVTAALVAFIVISLLFLNEYFLMEKEDIVLKQQLEPESISLAELTAHEDSVLTSYGVIDKEAGVYRIPLAQALELVAQEAISNNKK